MNARPDRWPAADAVSADLSCARVGGCDDVSACWPRGRCMALVAKEPRPKQGQRKKDSDAIRKALLQHRECVCCGEPPSDGHHVLFRSHGGDDVVENIAPLTHVDHMMFHAGDRDALIRIGDGLLDQNVEYVIRKLGAAAGVDYLRRHYSRFVSFREGRRIYREKGPWDAHDRADAQH